MGAQQLQGEVLPSDQIASHSIGEIRPLELIAANPVDHFLAVLAEQFTMRNGMCRR